MQINTIKVKFEEAMEKTQTIEVGNKLVSGKRLSMIYNTKAGRWIIHLHLVLKSEDGEIFIWSWTPNTIIPKGTPMILGIFTKVAEAIDLFEELSRAVPKEVTQTSTKVEDTKLLEENAKLKQDVEDYKNLVADLRVKLEAAQKMALGNSEVKKSKKDALVATLLTGAKRPEKFKNIRINIHIPGMSDPEQTMHRPSNFSQLASYYDTILDENLKFTDGSGRQILRYEAQLNDTFRSFVPNRSKGYR